MADTKKTRICPICGREYTDYPALSRRDSITEICPDCGVSEALEDFCNNYSINNKEEENERFCECWD